MQKRNATHSPLLIIASHMPLHGIIIIYRAIRHLEESETKDYGLTEPRPTAACAIAIIASVYNA